MLKGFLLGVVAMIVAAPIGLYLMLVNGTISAGADSAPIPFETWAASTSLHATLTREAPRTRNPVPLTNENLVAGIQLYAKHCAICHGTSRGDASASPVAKGENPRPPQLATEGVEDDPQGVTFWKIDHGIRWTGMPAWKATLSTQQMWTLALFLKHMDKLPPAAQQAWQAVTNRGGTQPIPASSQSAPPP